MARRVAVMIDDEVLRTLFREMIEQNGHEPTVLCPTDHALEQLKTLMPDVLILDVRLKDRDPGWVLLDEVRRDPSTSALPVILLTADADRRRTKRNASVRPGCYLLRKPFGFLDVSTMLARVLGEHG